jgi:hypothetical protein
LFQVVEAHPKRLLFKKIKPPTNLKLKKFSDQTLAFMLKNSITNGRKSYFCLTWSNPEFFGTPRFYFIPVKFSGYIYSN